MRVALDIHIARRLAAGAQTPCPSDDRFRQLGEWSPVSVWKWKCGSPPGSPTRSTSTHILAHHLIVGLLDDSILRSRQAGGTVPLSPRQEGSRRAGGPRSRMGRFLSRESLDQLVRIRKISFTGLSFEPSRATEREIDSRKEALGRSEDPEIVLTTK
ncbi:hypothetical protein BJX63DRAFT_116671 [Aspergillus granulosus]|uniref:Uncharacterized protein n=1 Tax=Aspergillus granulosus TaxID=176169 RepID=A0ABR4HNN2_9EURO